MGESIDLSAIRARVAAAGEHSAAGQDAWWRMAHAAPADLAALCDEVERLTRERDDADAELERVEGEARGALVSARAQRDEARAEVERLRAILDGRTTAPTPQENAAHDAAGGWWRYQTDDDFGDATCQDVELIREAWSITRWWALDASGAPCAWPEVTP